MRTRVVVIGGGPVGMGLAIELGRRDVPVVVLEKEEVLHAIPKGQNLTQRTMEHFRAWGVEREIRAARLMPPGYPAAGVNAYGDLMSPYAHPWFRRSAVDRYYFTDNERLPQYQTEAVLRARADAMTAVTAHRGTRVMTVDQDDSGVIVTTPDDTFEADYAIGCDGSHSLVREQAGIGEELSDHDRRMALLVFRSRELHELLEQRFGPAAFFNVLHPDLDGYWRFLGRVDVGEKWFFHAPVDPDATVDDLDYRGLITEAVGADVAVDLDYVGFWDLRIAVADSYQRGRILIAGDAAHSHPPYGGYGINLGLEDVRNLGWKLAAVIQGWGGPHLLRSYTEERRPVFVSTANDFIEKFIENDRKFISEHDPTVDETEFAQAWELRSAGSNRSVSEFEPHYEGSPIVFGPPDGLSGAVGSHDFTARPGHHLPPAEKPSRDELFDSLGSGFTLITADPGSAVTSSFISAARDLGVPLRAVGADTTGYGARQVMVRPDHFVSWVDDGSAYDPRAVLSRSTAV